MDRSDTAWLQIGGARGLNRGDLPGGGDMTDTEAADLYSGFAEPFLSFPALVALLLVALPVAAFVGFHLGNGEYRRRGYDKVAAEQIPGGTSLGAMVALLELLLGFAFSSALGWREPRQSTLVEEAMAISTAFLTADLLEDPGRYFVPDGMDRLSRANA